MGDYSSSFGSLPLEGKIAQYLSDARRVLLHGYQDGVGPEATPGDWEGDGYEFQEKAITLEEIKKKKIPITNISPEEAKKLGVPNSFFL